MDSFSIDDIRKIIDQLLNFDEDFPEESLVLAYNNNAHTWVEMLCGQKVWDDKIFERFEMAYSKYKALKRQFSYEDNKFIENFQKRLSYINLIAGKTLINNQRKYKKIIFTVNPQSAYLLYFLMMTGIELTQSELNFLTLEDIHGNNSISISKCLIGNPYSDHKNDDMNLKIIDSQIILPVPEITNVSKIPYLKYQNKIIENQINLRMKNIKILRAKSMPLIGDFVIPASMCGFSLKGLREIRVIMKTQGLWLSLVFHDENGNIYYSLFSVWRKKNKNFDNIFLFEGEDALFLKLVSLIIWEDCLAQNFIIRDYRPETKIAPLKIIERKPKPIIAFLPRTAYISSNKRGPNSQYTPPYTVRQHVRRLPDGWNASKEAIKRALSHGIILKEGYTFVGEYNSNDYSPSIGPYTSHYQQHKMRIGHFLSLQEIKKYII